MARFIQPDSVVPEDLNSQALNRYSYCINNPLRFSDPTGHGFFDEVKKFFEKAAGTIMTIAFSIAGMPFVGALIGSAMSTAISGGTFADFAVGFGIGLTAGIAAGPLSSRIATDLFGWKARYLQTAALRGALSGSGAGAITSAVYGQDVGKGALEGGLTGLATSSIAWGFEDRNIQRFIENDMNFDPGMTRSQVDAVKAAVHDYGHSPIGQKMLNWFRKSGATLNIGSEMGSPHTVPGNPIGPHVTSSTDNMYFDGDFLQSPTGRMALALPNQPWWRTASDGLIFGHEFGHLSHAYNARDPINVTLSENPYRAWMGGARRAGYYSLSDVPKRPLRNRIISPWR